MAKKKSYLMNMQLEMLTDDDETVKAIHIHHLNNEPIPLQLFCDFLERLNRMVPEESVLFVGDYDPHYADPISPETKEMIEKVSKGWGRRNNV